MSTKNQNPIMDPETESGKNRHIIITPETDKKIEAFRSELRKKGVSISRTAVVAMAVSEKVDRSEEQK